MQPANYIAGFPTHPCSSDSGSGQEEQPLCFVAYQDRAIQLTPDPPPPASVFVNQSLPHHPLSISPEFFFNGSFL